MIRGLLLSLTCFLLAASARSETAWERTLVLDETLKVQIWWNATKENGTDGGLLDFEIFAPTSGYVGVGFSPNGAMRGSDIVVGWVDAQGKGHLKDFHGIGNQIPVLDEQQDCELIEASETPEGTTIRFRRKLRTCDDDDFAITNHTTRLMWSFGDKDPEASENSVSFSYHGADNRGVKSVYMLDLPIIFPFPDQVENPDPDIQHWDVRVNVSHSEDTMYYCNIVRFPKVQQKHHMIGFRPLISKENKKFVHHICLYECVVPDELGGTIETLEKHLDHEGGKCYSPNMPPEWAMHCVGFFVTWVSGGEGEMFPAHVGSPIGLDSGASTYFMMEVHYDNPKHLPITDNSGLRIFYTENLRENDGNVLLVSYRITPFLLIPPKQERFTTVGICSRECTEATFPKEGIKVVSVLLHGHLAARSLRLRHFRNGTELPMIRDDKSYDFNYQQTRFLREEVTVLPGDELVTECDYNTQDRGRSVLGGLSTQQEMCQSFVMYYPRVEVALCSSQYEFNNFFTTLGIDNVTSDVFPAMNVPYNPNLWPADKRKYEPSDNAKDLEKIGAGKSFTDVFDLMDIQAPEQLKNKSVGDYLQGINWKSTRFSKKVQRKWKNGKHYAYCTAHGRKRIPLEDFIVDYPKHARKGAEVDPVCAA